MPPIKAYLKDETETAALGQALAAVLMPGMVIYLYGDLGAGKTALTRALLQAAGHKGKVKSPTYTLAEPYDVIIANQPTEVIHFDLYRMASPEEFLDAGFREYFNPDNICIVEWPEKGAGVLPQADIAISIDTSGQGREVECQAMSDQGSQCLDRLQFVPNH